MQRRLDRQLLHLTEKSEKSHMLQLSLLKEAGLEVICDTVLSIREFNTVDLSNYDIVIVDMKVKPKALIGKQARNLIVVSNPNAILFTNEGFSTCYREDLGKTVNSMIRRKKP